MSESAPVYVVGSGPAGLAAALALARCGLPVRVIERGAGIGGKVNSAFQDGRSYEHGVHGWWHNYVNFNRLLEWAGVDLNTVFKVADSSVLIMNDGSRHELRGGPTSLPSPLFLVQRMLRSDYLRTSDLFKMALFGVHMLSFRHELDYHIYDHFSFQDLVDTCKVPASLQQYLLIPFIASFEFTTTDRVSAACGLSGLDFYLLHDPESVTTRWARGLPDQVIFEPLAHAIEQHGGTVSLNTTVLDCEASAGGIVALHLSSPNYRAAAGPSVLASVPASSVPAGTGVRVQAAQGEIWVSYDGTNYLALDMRCTHMGCTVAWSASGNCFICPCHGGEYDSAGRVLSGPPPQPLTTFATQLNNGSIELLGTDNSWSEPCNEVILATDVEAAKRIAAQSPTLDRNLLSDIQELDTTPVIVIRLWFKTDVVIQPDIQSALMPGFEFLDNLFHLNDFDEEIQREGQVIEAQVYRESWRVESDDEEILNLTFHDLATVDSAFTRENLTFYTINRHRALFTRYAPGQSRFRPKTTAATQGLYLAGDWVDTPWSVWMMERGVVSGLRAANAVLERRGLPKIEILRISPEGLLLRVSRAGALFVRVTVLRGFLAKRAPAPELNNLGLEYRIAGAVLLLAAVLKLAAPPFGTWPLLAIACAALVYTHGSVRDHYGSLLRSWTDPTTFERRMAGVLLASGAISEMARGPGVALPAALVACGIVFLAARRKSMLLTRQNSMIGFLLLASGAADGVLRVASLASWESAPPLLLAGAAFGLMTYRQGARLRTSEPAPLTSEIVWERPPAEKRARHEAKRDSGVARLVHTVGLPRHAASRSAREEAIFLLQVAAEIEHTLMLQYLYAAYSIDENETAVVSRRTGRNAADWQNDVIGIAREEMAHLLTVQNLLLFLGADCHLGRGLHRSEESVFPFSPELEPLSLDSLAKYVAAEMPMEESLTAGENAQVRGIRRRLKTSVHERVQRVGLLYLKIYLLFQTDETPQGPWKIPLPANMPAIRHLRDEDFAPVDRVRHLEALGPEWFVDPSMHITTDAGETPAPGAPDLRRAALEAIAFVTAQGEGLASTPQSHFQRFLKMWLEMNELSRSGLPYPVFAVATNPAAEAESRSGGERIQDSAARAWAALANRRYRILLLDIAIAMSPADGDKAIPRAQIALWAVQTEMQALRDIGRLLRRMPATAGSRVTSGLPFEPDPEAKPADESCRWQKQLKMMQESAQLAAEIGLHASDLSLAANLVEFDRGREPAIRARIQVLQGRMQASTAENQ